MRKRRMMNASPDLLDLSPDEVLRLIQDVGEKPYRARQLLAWVYQRGETRFERMTTLGRDLRAELGRRLRIGGGRVEEAARSPEQTSVKYLFALDDGMRVEAVSLRDRGRHTVCLSSQVGCAMGCAFCATAGLGFRRNLTCGEILVQALTILREEGRFSNVVLMGMGEPLLNLPNVLKAVEALSDPGRLGLGARRIAVSTCGIPAGIMALAESAVRVRLALSLNSPFQEQRAELMPIARKHPLREVLECCEAYTAATGRLVTLEYVLLRGLNMSRRAATALAGVAVRLAGKVNLIEYNPNPGLPFESPRPAETLRFRHWLEQDGVKATIRFRRGRDIAAGCGQLAARPCGVDRKR